MFAKDFKYIREQRNARPKQNQSTQIQWIPMLFAVVRKMQVDHEKTEQPYRDIHKQDIESWTM